MVGAAGFAANSAHRRINRPNAVVRNANKTIDEINNNPNVEFVSHTKSTYRKYKYLEVVKNLVKTSIGTVGGYKLGEHFGIFPDMAISATVGIGVLASTSIAKHNLNSLGTNSPRLSR